MTGLALVNEPTNELPQGPEQHTPRRSSPESEAAVLGCLLAHPELLPQVRQLLTKSDFASKNHETIFETMLVLAEKEQLCDVLAVSDFLKTRDAFRPEQFENKLEEMGGRQYLTDIMAAGVNPGFLRSTCERIWDFARKRQLGTGFLKLQSKIQEGEELTKLTADLQSLIESATPRVDHPWQLAQVLPALSLSVEERGSNEDKVGLKVNFGTLDGYTKGFRPGALVVLGGRPSMGKTMLCLNMLQNIAVYKRKPIAFFSLEMSVEEVFERMLSRQARIPADKIKTGKMESEDWAAWKNAENELYQAAPVCIFDGRHKINTLNGIKARLQQMKQIGIEPAAIGIDYIQLMQGEDPKKQATRNYELEAVSRGLKQLAAELGIPVIVLSQLGRAVEQRPNKRPEMSDLRDSGSLEQDADIILFIYRDERYNPDTADKGIAELIIAKQRNGELGTCVLQYQPEYQSFWDSELHLSELESRKPKDKERYKRRKPGSTHAAHTEADN